MSSAALTGPPDVTAIEKVILAGDLKDLRPAERLAYYNRVCESLGLNPLTQPFAYLVLSGKMTLYARKDAAEQLRSVREIGLVIKSRELIDGMYVVTASARTPKGREDESTGVVDIANLKGEAKANAMMKAETKAKRRVTLSICGLGLMDETEVATIEGARTVSVEQAHTLIEAGHSGGAAAETPAAGGIRLRRVPEELMVAIDKLRKGDFSAVKQATTFIQEECIVLGIERAFLDRSQGIRASFPKGARIPAAVMEGFFLDVWELIEAARLEKAATIQEGTEAPGDKPKPVYAEGVEEADVPF